ncbi:MAG: hypothetical protein JEY94_17585 [Melioribacteraceae bacterium]|nr:hypothetical protein [Melioribacteraceae bacterium]
MIKYYFSELWNLQKQAKLATFISVSIALISVIFVTFSIISVLASTKINERLKSKIEINLFVEDSVSQNQINNIKRQLESETIISKVSFISKKEALRKFSAETGEEFKELLESNPFPASFVLKFKPEKISKKSIDVLITRLSGIDGIDETVYNKNYLLDMLSIIDSVKNAVYILAVLLIIVSIYLIYTTSILVINSKLDQYETMKLVGAKLSSLKIPIYLNGLAISLITSVLGILFFMGVNFISIKIFNYAYLSGYELYIAGVIPFIALFMGILGAFFAARKVNLKVESF